MTSRLPGDLLRAAAPVDELEEAVHRHTSQPADVHRLDVAAEDQLVEGAPAHGQALGGLGDGEHHARRLDDLDFLAHGGSPSRLGWVVRSDAQHRSIGCLLYTSDAADE